MSPDEVTTATAEPEATPQPSSTRRLLSGDGAWWWNGRRWVPATTEDGLWKWDGTRWKGTVDLEGKRPEDLATTLALLAEDRYADPGATLAERASEWHAQGGPRDPGARAREAARRAVEAAESAHAWAGGEARARMRTVLTPGPGELKAGVGPLRLHANLLETPTGRVPAAGSTAHVDTAQVLWTEHRGALADLALMEAPEPETFLDALTETHPPLFLLFVCRTAPPRC